MSYQSFIFIIFSAVVLLAYYTFGRKKQLWVLGLANLIFYIWAGIQYVPFLFVTMLATFFAGKKIGLIYEDLDSKLASSDDTAVKKELRNTAKKEAKKILLWSLATAIVLLAVCKYTGFVLQNVNSVISLFNLPKIKLFDIILPVGISFYTFMAISYVLDIYWKRYKYENNYLKYAVYLSYFPHIVQGPIDRFNEFKEQTKETVLPSYKNITFGAQLSLWGFFKKLVIADRLGQFISPVLSDWQNYNGLSIFFVIVLYSIQIYADFSGCIDIVSGVSEMFGIKMRKNFNHPYFSKTMPEFWRRWHISLQEWFKDYVYYPVSASGFTKKIKKRLKNNGKKRLEELFTSCFPILVVWLITGIWHGANWNFVVWGLFHASLLIGSQVFEPLFTKFNTTLHIRTESFPWRLYQMIRTYFLCCVGRIFFRAPTLSVALAWIHKMVTNLSLKEFLNDFALSNLHFTSLASLLPFFVSHIIPIFVLVYAIIVLWIVDIIQEKFSIREKLSKKPLIFRWLLIYALLFSVLILGIYGPGYDFKDFIYQKF